MRHLIGTVLDAAFQVLRRPRGIIILALVLLVGSGVAFVLLPSPGVLRQVVPAPVTTNPTSTPAYTPPTGPPEPSLTTPADTPSPQTPAERAAVNFTQAYTHTRQPRDAWLADVGRHASQDLTEGLRHADRSVIPTSPPVSARITQQAHVSAQVTVTLQNGTRLGLAIGPGDCPGGFCVASVSLESR